MPPERNKKKKAPKKDPSGKTLPGGANAYQSVGVSAGSGVREDYRAIPSAVSQALRTGRVGGVKLSRATIAKLREQYGGLEGQEFEVSGIKWGKRRGSGTPIGRSGSWGKSRTVKLRTTAQESDLYEADAALERFVDMARTNPAEFAKYQKQLLARRMYDESYYKGKSRKQLAYGMIDEDTLSAFEKALGIASVTGDLDEVLWKPLTPEQKKAMYADITASGAGAADAIDEVDIENQMMKVENHFRKWSVPISEATARQYAERLLRSKSRGSSPPPEGPGVEFG
jgi:hypothetical protein